ncbi:hypothetical protein [Amycolatopsis jejuensis]|uniref:hypothetical protein n=1 Tax=Amycolatopsis jejuensis TaxID=330084 RepID=UPI0005256EDA|nr:hypothetical protein [Amycolatopsis jejuensis]
MFRDFKERRRRKRAERNQSILVRYQAQAADRREAARTPPGQLDPLVRELIDMGYESGYLDNPRARKIGELLNSRGGLGLMQDVYYEVLNWHFVTARELQRAWHGVGDWQA